MTAPFEAEWHREMFVVNSIIKMGKLKLKTMRCFDKLWSQIMDSKPGESIAITRVGGTVTLRSILIWCCYAHQPWNHFRKRLLFSAHKMINSKQVAAEAAGPTQKRIYLISMGAMVIGATDSQRQLLSTTTMNRLLLGICWMTKDLWKKED